MKIAVCVKHVPDRLRLEEDSGRIDRGGSGDVNRFDLYAVEEALRLRADGDEVVSVSMGPQSAAETLRTTLGLGADRAVLVNDPGLAGSDLVSTARVLAKALEREEPDLILFGQQSSDGGGAALWAAVAEGLRRPAVSQATKLERQADRVRVTRQTEAGDEVVEATLPAVVAVTDAINEPRYASLKGMMAAKRKPLEVVDLAGLGVDPATVGDAGSRTVVLGLGPPPARAGATKVEDTGQGAQAVVDFLVARGLV
jgi:electron transfer flavoprotein beta subunit